MADKESLKKLVQGRQKALESRRNLWDSLRQEIADFVIPIREDTLGTLLPGQKQGQRIYDGTAVGAALTLADGLYGYLFSPTTPWFKLQIGDPKIDSIRSVRMWLQDVSSLLYTALGRSNFYDMVWMYLYDGSTIGTATIYAERDEINQRMVFEAEHPGEVYIEENHYGKVDTRFRKRKMTAKQAVEKFGLNNLPESVKQQHERDPYREDEWIHAIYPREEHDNRSMLAAKKKWASVWMHNSTGQIALESGYDEFPIAAWRYMKDGKSAYGRSPAMMALCDIKGSNLMEKTLLGSAQMAVNSPWLIPSEMRDKLQLFPGGRNYYDDPNRVPKSLNANINYPIGIEHAERKQRIIEQHFHVDFFLALARSEIAKTATEVWEIKSEKAVVLGSTVGRLNSEAIDTMIDLVFDAELKAGRLPEPPMELQEMPGEPIQIVYLGPLAQAQRQMFLTQGIKSGLEAVAPLFQMFPESADAIDPLKTAQQLLIANGFPAEGMNDEQVVNEIRQAKTKANQQAQLKQIMVEGAPVVKDIAMADKAMGGKLSKALAGATA